MAEEPCFHLGNSHFDVSRMKKPPKGSSAFISIYQVKSWLKGGWRKTTSCCRNSLRSSLKPINHLFQGSPRIWAMTSRLTKSKAVSKSHSKPGGSKGLISSLKSL